jgi:hypothetical protein
MLRFRGRLPLDRDTTAASCPDHRVYGLSRDDRGDRRCWSIT